MITSIIQVILIFVIPYLIIRFKDFKLTKIFGTIGMAYFFGLVVAGLILLLKQIGIDINLNSDTGETTSFVAIGIGIPLLLFGSNLKEAKKLSKMVLVSFSALIVAVIVVTTIVFFVYGRTLPQGDALSAAAIGLYTGGTPNLNAITKIFGVASDRIALANLSDMVIGAVFYVFLLLAAKPLLSKILKGKGSHVYLKEESHMKNTEDFNVKDFKTSKRLFVSFLLAIGMAAVGAGIGVLIWVILGSKDGAMLDMVVPSLMISVTVFGIIASFNKKIRETEGTNILGHYLILVFSFAIASSVDFTQLANDFTKLFILYSVCTVGSFFLHVIFAYFLKIDADCMMVTATAGIYGPAFVPAISKQIKNDSLTVPGLICGSIGYAIGTFIGVGLGLLFALGM